MQQKEFGANMCYLYLTWCASLNNTVYTMGKKSCSGLSTVLRAPSRVQLFLSANTSVAKVCYFWWSKSLIIFSSSKEDSSVERQHCCEERKLSLVFSQLDHLRLCFKRGRGLEIKLIQRCHYVTDNVGNPFTSKLNDGFFTGSIFVNNKS